MRITKQKMIVEKIREENRVKINNKHAIGCTRECIEDKILSLELQPPINHVALLKQMHIPCKLVEMASNNKIKEFIEIEGKSSFKCKSQFLVVLKPSLKTKAI